MVLVHAWNSPTGRTFVSSLSNVPGVNLIPGLGS